MLDHYLDHRTTPIVLQPRDRRLIAPSLPTFEREVELEPESIALGGESLKVEP